MVLRQCDSLEFRVRELFSFADVVWVRRFHLNYVTGQSGNRMTQLIRKKAKVLHGTNLGSCPGP